MTKYVLSFCFITERKYFRILPALAVVVLLGLISCEREVSVTPPDIPPPEGSIYIDSNPPGAKIFVNGRDRIRVTPDSINWLAAGDYEITLKKEYFMDTTIIVNIQEGERKNIFIDYYSSSAMLGSLACVSIPSNALITINDSATGRLSPYTFSNMIPGYYAVKYSLEGHRSTELVATVISNQTTTLSAALVDTTVWMDYNVANNALPTNQLTSILSASGVRGALWIGTETLGLLKYVRGEWVNYDATNSLISHNQINCIEQDSLGHIWVGTRDGLTEIQPNLYHTDPRRDDELTQWNFRNTPLQNMNINAVGIGSGNALWVGTNLGLTQLRISDQYNWGPSVTSANSNLPGDIVTAIAVVGLNKFVGTETGGIATFTTYTDMTIYNASSGLSRNNVSAIAVDRENNVWVGHKSAIGVSGGLSKFNGTSWEKLSYIISNENVNAIYIDSHNRKWVGTNRALFLIANNIAIGQYNFDNVGLHISNITGITENKEGFIWVSTYGNGIFRINPNNLF